MPPIKQLPPRSCATCGLTLERKRYNGRLEDFGVFTRRKFCGEECFALRAQILTTNPSWMTAHYHARKAKAPGPCETCGKSGRDVHHIDWNHQNNDPENLKRLCRGCHLREHRYAG